MCVSIGVQSMEMLAGERRVHMEKNVRGQQPSSRTTTFAFVRGGAEKALPEPCKIISSLKIGMLLLIWSETDSMRMVWYANFPLAPCAFYR